MIRGNFLNDVERQELTSLVRDGLAETRVTRRANALLLLDRGWSCERVAEALYMDDDTIRYWHKLWTDQGFKWLCEFGYKGQACAMTAQQQADLKVWVSDTLPRTTGAVGEWIDKHCGISYTRSAIIKLLKRLDMEYRKPKALPRKLDPAKQEAFIKEYESLLNTMGDDEVVLFADAVHPTHEARPAGCWAPKGQKIVIGQTSGRDRLNLHGFINLETGETRLRDVLTVNAQSAIDLLTAAEIAYPKMRKIHVFWDNAKYHHAEMVQKWLNRPDCRIVLHFVPAYCPHLVPIERLWGLMHKNVTHNKCYEKFSDFSNAVLGFLRYEIPKNWHKYRDKITDNFRVINPAHFRVL